MDIQNLKFPNLNVDIKKVQEVELEILLEFDRLCKEHGIKYQLCSGTLLGAIRHKGFIPWDDDIDVCMLREEYMKFLDISNENLDKRYFLQTNETDKNYNCQFAKIRKNHTIFMQEIVKETNIHQGIFIDIFPFDNVKINNILGKMQRIVLNFILRLNYFRLKQLVYNTSNNIIRYLKLIIHYLMKIIPKSLLDNLTLKIMSVFNGQDTKYVGELSLSLSKNLYDRFTIEKRIFYDTIEWEFEGHKFPVPREYDYVLTKNYGDYMTPPPLEQQKPHHDIIEICFDTTLENRR